jgi:valyl-tRNA synthetase
MPHELPKSYEPGAIETRWAEYWIKEKLFSVPTPPPGETRPVFAMMLPPPNVTGRLHMGHMLNQTQMDIIARWHRMRGFITLWLPGTDHASIATQMMVERQLASEGKKRRDLGRERFIERVWEWKKLYGGAILDQMKRLGVSVDWDREYFTMDENLSRAVREVFVRLYEDGLIYRGKYIVNWCPRCGTAISDLEVKHEDVAGKLWEIRYPVVGTTSGNPEFITVATTRPETMLGDTAVAVNAKDERYAHLHGKFVLLPLMNREIPIITDDLAQPEFGTGAVKVTPAHDPNDFQAGLRHNLPQIDVMDEHAHMNANAGAYAGLDRYEARKRVLADLQEQGFLVDEKDYTLGLGKCERCGTVVEPRLSAQWFVKIKPLAEHAIKVVEEGEITITPDNFKQMYLNWMYNIHDWCISRQLWWGHRIPAWHCRDCSEIIVAREEPSQCSCGGKVEQDPDVLDTWFSSGFLPFTALGWPEKTRDQEVFYPTTLLVTAYEILFLWVSRMIMTGCYFMKDHKQDPAIKKASGWADKKDDSVPFRQVYIHALVRDAERQKMSKTKGNVIDPLEIIERFGTDATRFTLAAMAAPGTDIAFSESRTEGYRAFANKIWNAARFMFMNVDRIEPGLRPVKAVTARLDQSALPGSGTGLEDFQPVTLEDRWIFSRLNRVTKDVNEALTSYRFHEAANRVYDFFWGDFCDWYIEMIKPRLMSNVGDEARAACANLVSLFDAALRLLHPFMPFITEEIWQAIYDGKPPLRSVALASYPQTDERKIDLNSETEMSVLQDLIISVRQIRLDLKVEGKVKVPIELFIRDAGTSIPIMQNWEAIKRLANVESVTNVEEWRARQTPSRGTSRFDVRIPPENFAKKIDVEAECARLRKDLEGLEKRIDVAAFQLGNQNFLLKAPPKVVEGLSKQLEDMKVLAEKAKGTMRELGCG